MDILKRVVLYLRHQELTIKNNANEVEKSNGKLAFAILVMGCIAVVPFLAISLLVDAYKNLTVAYSVVFCVLLFLLLVFPKLRQYFSSAGIVYAGYAFLVGYAIYTSAWITPAYISVIILFFLFQIPIIVIDKSWRVNLVVVVYAAIYMAVAIPFKDAGLVVDEILNCLLFTVFGIGLGEILRYTRLENFELKRESLIREKIDDLTGLNNRKSLFEYLNRISSSAAENQILGILMIDIDYFKAYNDTYGHQAGDACLKRMGDYLWVFGEKSNVKFFRYGGEEFVGVTIDYKPEELLQIGEKLNRAVFDMKIPHSGAECDFVTISTGVSTAEDASAAGYERQILSQADIALYAAKTQGRNRAVRYTQGMTMKSDFSLPN